MFLVKAFCFICTGNKFPQSVKSIAHILCQIIIEEEGLTPEVIAAVMSEEKANQREMFEVPMERIRKYVPNANAKQAEDFVMKACEHYRRYLLRQRDRER